jgi:plasmid maintenance system antidote protein VapI
MIGVDKIGEIRRAFFERQLPIKEIVRTLSVSRATVREVIRGKAPSSGMSVASNRRRNWANGSRF